MIVIPIPASNCNQDWNYQNHGDDWKCDCSEGKEQSPIDLPKKTKAIPITVSPVFKYSEVKAKEVKTMQEGKVRETETLKFKLADNNSLRIDFKKFGKVVTPDGAVFDAEEIVIHTPAEHQINGQKFDMEVQIIHNGKSVGDIGRQVVLCFLFEKRPGVYNKFIDDLDFFNLPNPLSPVVDIVHDIFIPKILYTSDDTDEPKMRPFSFYTYQGSLTAPPCSEDTIMYVASRPLQLGTTALHLFQEALRTPDKEDEKGNISVSDLIPMSNRNIQPINGRPVFHYDHEKICGPDKKGGNRDGNGNGNGNNIYDLGHYEKMKQIKTNYFFVPGTKASGLPNAFYVSKNEALGIE